MATPTSIQKPVADFESIFKALTGNPPYPWQCKLFELFLSGTIPPNIDLPTGSGKTSIMSIWLLALARQAQRPRDVSLPRRLVWVVDRRVVVDQATEEAGEIRKRLADVSEGSQLQEVRDSLRKISLGRENAEVIAISTLRGEKEDNREWSDDPSRPAIIVGTVDKIGSSLLFSGYGNGLYFRAQHAGLLGQDALIVNDEAHLTPAFAALLSGIERAQQKPVKSFRTIRLSATHTQSTVRWPQSLDDDCTDKHFRDIFEAEKQLQLHTVPASRRESKMIELAIEFGPARTLIFVQKPENARKIAAELTKKGASQERILTLTGTMRGFERDQMVEGDVFKVFANRERPTESCWIVATSAGEVGVNISADRLITEVAKLDHLLQRFGRLNRFGETTGRAHVVLTQAEEEDEDNKSILEFLCADLPKTGAINISPAALFGRPLPEAGCTKPPLQAMLHDWLIDVWSQTSLGAHPARPQVDPWLHGKQDNYPETYLAWRKDVFDLVRGDIDASDREEILEKYRLLAHEQLREPTRTLVEKLEQLEIPADRDSRILCRKADASVKVLDLREDIVRKLKTEKGKREVVAQLAYCQLVFPPDCGTLENGMFSPGKPSSPGGGAVPYDVSGCQMMRGQVTRASFRATRLEGGAGGWSLERMGAMPGQHYEPVPLQNIEPETLRTFAAEHGWRFLLAVEPEPQESEEEEVGFALLYFGKVQRANSTVRVYLKDHLPAVGKMAKELGQKVAVDEELVRALERAGELHDLGKQERIWQKAARNTDREGKLLGDCVAKSILPMLSRDLGGFRHELASLRHAEQKLQGAGLSPEIRDLVLHLIAAHHGHARPCFLERACDRDHLRESARLALETVQRFGRLQERYGAWGLAYLESILKAADGLASADVNAEEQPANA